MTFLHPEFIYYMIVPLIALFALLLTQKEKQGVFFSDEVMQKLRVNSKRMSLRARNALFFVIALLLIVSLAQPVIPNGKVEIKAKSADIMIALDISDSMLAADVYPSRLELAKHKILELLKSAPNERIGVIAFAKSSYLVSPLSFDHDAVSFLTRQLEPSSITEKGTDILQLLSSADEMLKEQKNRYLLLFSDGGDDQDFGKEIGYAKEHKITVFVMAVGTKKGAPIKEKDGFITQNGKIIISKLNDKIASLATSTGGVYIESVNSPRDIEQMLSEIESHSKQKTLKSQTITQYIPLFYLPIGFALFLLLIATSSMGKREVINVPSAFVIAVFLFASIPSYAGVMDFKLLGDAKEAYEKGEYKKSTLLYDEYTKGHDTDEANYNLASSLYQEKKYKKASELYGKVHFSDKNKQADLLYDLANSYAKSGELQKALNTYDRSLALKADKDAKENRDIVEKLLKKRENKEQNKQENKQQDEQKQKNQENQQQSQNKQNKENKKQNRQEGENKEENKQQEQEKQEKEQNKEKQSSEKSEKKQSDSKNSMNKDKKEKNQEEQETKTQKSDKEEQQKMQSTPDEAATEKEMMSEKEEQKWLKRLNTNTPAHIYKIQPMKIQKDDSNDKPW